MDVIDIHEPDEVLPDIDAHGFLMGVYRGTIKPSGNRLRAAIACLGYEKPALKAVAKVDGGDLADRLNRAIEASEKIRPMQVIEAKPVEPDEVPDHSAPFAHNTKHRFRRI